jgi:MoaA/NifB/PqqE/SkfB family radical SAM enzyme
MEKQFLGRAIVSTGFGCNSNCIFCLQEKREPSFLPAGEIKKKIAEERERGAVWLVLTGGEASIHEGFLDFVRLGKQLGYGRIQTVTNGRMFSSRTFTRKAAAAGLTEVTISFHGSTPEKHDALTRTPGSFEEASRGALNCRDAGIQLSFNTALNSLNVHDLANILKHIYESLGFRRFDYDVVGTSPNGLAWRHRLLPEHEDVKQGLREAFEYAEKRGIVVWVPRTPIQDFPRGYEYHKEPWESITNDTLAVWGLVWNAKRTCDPLKCEYCENTPFCDHIRKFLSADRLSYVTGAPVPEKLEKAALLSERFLVSSPEEVPAVEDLFEPFFRAVFDGLNHDIDSAVETIQDAGDAGVPVELEFRVNMRSLESLPELRKFKPVFAPTNPYPYVKYSFDDGNRLHDTTGALTKLGGFSGDWKDVPLCIHRGRDLELSMNLDDFTGELKVKPRSFVSRLATDVRVYKWECSDCALRDKCPGFFGDYVKLFGFPDVRAFSRRG